MKCLQSIEGGYSPNFGAGTAAEFDFNCCGFYLYSFFFFFFLTSIANNGNIANTVNFSGCTVVHLFSVLKKWHQKFKTF